MVKIRYFNKNEKSKNAFLMVFMVMISYISYNMHTSVDAIEFDININKHTSNSNNCNGKVLCTGKSGTVISSNIVNDKNNVITSVVDINNDNKTILSNATSFNFNK